MARRGKARDTTFLVGSLGSAVSPPLCGVHLMRFAAVFLTAFACSGAFASEPGQPSEDPAEKAKQTTEDVKTFMQKYEQAQKDEDAKLFKMGWSLWKDVKCVSVDTPSVTGSDEVRKVLATDSLRDALILRLANDLSFLPVCQGDPDALPKGNVAQLSLFVDTAGTDYPVAYTAKLEAVILFGARVQKDCIQEWMWRSEDWQAEPQLGFGFRVNLREMINTLVKQEVETFATFMARVRSTDFGKADSSTPKDK